MGRSLALLCLLGGAALARVEVLPADVRAFAEGAESCAHFSNEPAELGAHPTAEEKKRAKFVNAQAKKACDPLAAREKALRTKYGKDTHVLCAIDAAMQPMDDRKMPAVCNPGPDPQ